MKTDLIIIGGGAAGLMAAVEGAERGLRCVVLERKHQPGRKLLMCGNARCNLSTDSDAAGHIAAYGEPVADFLTPSLAGWGPNELRQWFQQHGLQTKIQPDGRIYPVSERSVDVLHVFTDQLRERSVPMMYNAAVEQIAPIADGWCVSGDSFSLNGRNVLLATGGVSYPKTGSVGDGQKFAAALGHKVRPFRPGLVGFEMEESWFSAHDEESFYGVSLRVLDGKRRVVGETSGEIRCARWGITGPAVVNASRLIARKGLQQYSFLVDLLPMESDEQVLQRMDTFDTLQSFLEAAGVSAGLAAVFCREVLGYDAGTNVQRIPRRERQHLVKLMKQWPVYPLKSRSLKEAMVTVGGVSLDEIDPETMESRTQPGLYFAGEVMDVDGPTGGFNLHAAFATARTAIAAVAQRCGACPPPVRKKERKKQTAPHRNSPRSGRNKKPSHRR